MVFFTNSFIIHVVTGTLISYLYLCHRKLWLHARQMRMEHNSENVQEGKWISETTYDRRPKKWRELAIGNVKIDQFDPVEKVIREIKKSQKLEYAHIAQVQYYLYVLEQHGIHGATGIIEYPKQKKTTRIPALTDADRKSIRGWELEIECIVSLTESPGLVKKSYCKTCAFYEFCYV